VDGEYAGDGAMDPNAGDDEDDEGDDDVEEVP